MVTPFYVAISALIYVFISIFVIYNRTKYCIALGDGKNDKLKQIIRAHANFAEYTPIFLISLYCLETLQTNSKLMHCLGIAFLIGRAIHFYGMFFMEKYTDGILKSGSKMRVIGMVFTFTCLTASSLLLISKSF